MLVLLTGQCDPEWTSQEVSGELNHQLDGRKLTEYQLILRLIQTSSDMCSILSLARKLAEQKHAQRRGLGGDLEEISCEGWLTG